MECLQWVRQCPMWGGCLNQPIVHPVADANNNVPLLPEIRVVPKKNIKSKDSVQMEEACPNVASIGNHKSQNELSPKVLSQSLPTLLPTQVTVDDAFRTFLGPKALRTDATRIDGPTFVKGCRDFQLIGGHMGVTDADLIFAKLAKGPKGQRNMDVLQFKAALDIVASKKGTSAEDLCRKIQNSNGRVLTGTKAQPVRFHDDKTQYTGTHRHGGPDVGKKNKGHLPSHAHSDLTSPSKAQPPCQRNPQDPFFGHSNSGDSLQSGHSYNSSHIVMTVEHKNKATHEDEEMSLTEVFQSYCAGKPEMDGRTFVKLCKDCDLFGNGFAHHDADLIFLKLAHKGQRRIGIDQFRAALQLVAEKKKVDAEIICSAVASSSGRTLVGTKTEKVRFLDSTNLLLPRTTYEPAAADQWLHSLRPTVPTFVQQRLGETPPVEGPGPKDMAAFYLERQTIRRRRGSVRMQPPKDTDKVTMVFTDVQGSTSLWEANPRAMELALRIHDAIMRKNIAKYGGYEVTTEGDAFQAVFHDAIDAVAFCLDVQTELCNSKTDWPEAILRHPEAKPSKDGVWRGLRVRMGLHSGRPDVSMHELTNRWRYAGQSVAIAKAVEDACHGGQILLSAQSFAQIDGILQHLRSPQVVDLGDHILHVHGNHEPLSIQLHQLVPAHLAYDHFACDPDNQMVPEISGRLFPPILSKGQTSPGFQEAPSGSSVALCFVFTHGARDLVASEQSIAAKALGSLRACVRDLLRKDGKTGYECQEDEGAFMLAFDSLEHAAAFGAALQKALRKICWCPELRAIMPQGLCVAVGAFSGKYTSRGPHASTGRADYFGTMVNRTARIAAAASAGQVLLGVEEISSTSTEYNPEYNPAAEVPMPDASELERLGAFKLKGVEAPIALYEVKTRDDDGEFPCFPEPKTKGRVSD